MQATGQVAAKLDRGRRGTNPRRFSISTLEGKLIEHWDESNLLEIFQQIAATTVRKAEGQ